MSTHFASGHFNPRHYTPRHYGVVELEQVLEALGDPSTGSDRPAGWEPFDLSYFREKYRRQESLRTLTSKEVEVDTAAIEREAQRLRAEIDEQRVKYLEGLELERLQEIEGDLQKADADASAALEAQRLRIEALEAERLEIIRINEILEQIARNSQMATAAITATMKYFYH